MAYDLEVGASAFSLPVSESCGLRSRPSASRAVPLHARGALDEHLLHFVFVGAECSRIRTTVSQLDDCTGY